MLKQGCLPQQVTSELRKKKEQLFLVGMASEGGGRRGCRTQWPRRESQVRGQVGLDAGGGSRGSFVEEFSGLQTVRTVFRIEPRMEAAVLGWEARGPVYSPESAGCVEAQNSGVTWSGVESWLCSSQLCDLRQVTELLWAIGSACKAGIIAVPTSL